MIKFDLQRFNGSLAEFGLLSRADKNFIDSIPDTYAIKNNTELTGIPTAPNATLGTKTTQIATTKFVDDTVSEAISDLIGTAPETLNTLEEIAEAINNDGNAFTTLNNAIQSKQDESDALTSIAGLSTAENQMLYTTGSDTYVTTALTAFARSILDDVDAETVRNTIGALSITGTAVKADELTNSVNLNISDATAENVGTAISFNGSTGGTIKLPSTIKATLDGNASTATEATALSNARTIDGIGFDGSSSVNHYILCTTDGDRVTKNVTVNGFTLETGSRLIIKFANTNIAESPNLNVNDTGIKAIYYRGSEIPTNALTAGRIYEFVYDGTHYELVGDLNVDTNTHYATKLIVGDSSSTVNASTANNYTHIRLFDDDIARDTINIKGTGATSVTSDANGVITVDSSNDAVTQNVSSTNADYPMLAVATANQSVNATGNVIFGTGVKVNPNTSNITATTFTGALVGNASTASALQTSQTINISDADSSNTGTGISFDGSSGGVIKLPSTIKANLTGNASTATQATQDGNGNVITSTYATKDVATTTTAGLMSASDKTKLDVMNEYSFGVCSTAAVAAAKTVDIANFTLAVGRRVTVKFSITNTAANPTLNVNNTGAYSIFYRGFNIATEAIRASSIYDFIFTGNYYEVVEPIIWVED